MNSPQMYEYFIHCLKTTYKYFALPLHAPTANHKSEKTRGPAQAGKASRADPTAPPPKGTGSLGLKPQRAGAPPAADEDPLDSDCIIEQEEEVENEGDSDGEAEKEKMDLGKSSLSEDDDDDDDDGQEEEEEEDEDDVYGRLHLDSATTEDDELFQLDEISGEELLSDEEGPDFDVPVSMDEEEQAPPTLKPKVVMGGANDTSPETQNQATVSQRYEFTRHAFARGKVNYELTHQCCNLWQLPTRHKRFWC